MLFKFLLIVQMIIAACLVGVILVQRSEGGGLGVGSSSAGLMTARGAADFLTRATSVLATLFVVLSIALAGLATVAHGPSRIDPSLAKKNPAAPLSGAPPLSGVPLAGGAAGANGGNPLAGAAAAQNNAAPATQPANGSVPLQH